MYHNPVLLNESVEALRISPKGTYVDLTFGGGGHSRAILEKLTSGRLFAFDQDEQAFRNAPDDPRLTTVSGNFRYMIQFLRYYSAIPVDGILADLGVSSYQIDTPDRGFTNRMEAPLDMRMNISSEKNAAGLLATVTQEELAGYLYNYGDIKNSKQVAAAIINHRSVTPIKTSGELKEAVKRFVIHGRENQFLARLFQALRIAVNDEAEALKEMLMQTLDALKPGGRLAVISYHSLEDRLVKHFLRSGNFDDKPVTDFFGRSSSPFILVKPGAIKPSIDEIGSNPRSRSATLRIGERR